MSASTCRKTVRITVLKRTQYEDLIERYENPIEHRCDLHLGDVFYTDGTACPEGLCESAWETLRPFIDTLARGGGDFYDGWMKNPHSAMLSCNDGFRPVTFHLETV